ncbi:FAD-binding 9, siderophore-interacting domain protein (plasmid) [Ketogulonicigenium vulgare Y25]|uniref:Siderophore-interacting protein n=2 Tax=Ketogulonicigenium vulgare TaxID=92945 RepID=F9YB97_KETVW|nr:FAD-binding 9, siderophore-interacting domain protein [Ketogulonicigenium vulgare Y25]AEM42649.1 Siderophore-interacting protein [Ketogulonicigenium vulgare WSH-001]ALJ82454.1 siderophore synthetase [Ketogulonicigenium vulgare]ANW35241.1 siderophore synthetase [Ketogulonicigenium vulgare]
MMMNAPMITALGRLGPVTWRELQSFAGALSEFCAVQVLPDRQIRSDVHAGGLHLQWSDGTARVRIEAPSPASAQNLRDMLAYMLDNVREGLAADLRWLQNVPQAGALPPTFRFATVMDSQRITPRFQRIRLAAKDIAYLTQGGLHIRLLQPKVAADPRWPSLGANGRTIWPGGDHLHMPVYTMRAIDDAAGWIDVDIYLHGNGPTCLWAKTARAGTRIGITGPGGGGLSDNAHLILGGDETALPAIARMLEAAPAHATGQAMIEVAYKAEIQPIAAPAGVALTWLIRGNGPALATAFARAAKAALDTNPEAEIFFGGEKSIAQQLRENLRAPHGKLPANASIAAYWS